MNNNYKSKNNSTYEGYPRRNKSYGNSQHNNRQSSGNSSNNRFYGNFRRQGGRNNGRRNNRRPGFKFNESMFIKKACTITEEISYKSHFVFEDLDVNTTLKKNIRAKKFDIPTPIQDQAIKPIIEGKDLLGIADTGTGKTAAFLIPLIDRTINDQNNKTLIMTPTRELAEQINQEMQTLTRELRIYSVQCIGGNNIKNQIFGLRKGCNFVVGTPGRLKDLFDRKVLNLSIFNAVVIDEVDRMLDMGFVNEIKHLISFLPKERQSLCFSATVNTKIEEIINSLLKQDRVKISVKTGETAQNVEQDIVRISNHDEKLSKLEELLKRSDFQKVLVFANTKRIVDRLDKHLYNSGFKVESIHGDRRQSQRKRSIESFKNGRSKILVATDVAARGLDINNVTHVINYDIPMTYEDYIHRVGRTGRAQNKGLALTFVENNILSSR